MLNDLGLPFENIMLVLNKESDSDNTFKNTQNYLRNRRIFYLRKKECSKNV